MAQATVSQGATPPQRSSLTGSARAQRLRRRAWIVYNSAMTDTHSDSATRKREVRESALHRRGQLAEAAHASASARIREQLLGLPALQAARHVFTFISFGSEVNTHPLIDALLAAEYRVAVPRIMDATTIRAVPMTGWGDLEAGRWGILSPRHTTSAPGPFDVCIIPGVAFTEAGARLGHGRGYYDRWMESNQVGTCVAIAFECQMVPTLPMEPHDRPVDVIVTEQRVITPPRHRPQ